MFTDDLHRGASPTPEAYDSSWLELLENPDAILPYREGAGPDEAAAEAGSGPGAMGFSPVD
jgi:hypothetical protein